MNNNTLKFVNYITIKNFHFGIENNDFWKNWISQNENLNN